VFCILHLQLLYAAVIRFWSFDSQDATIAVEIKRLMQVTKHCEMRNNSISTIPWLARAHTQCTHTHTLTHDQLKTGYDLKERAILGDIEQLLQREGAEEEKDVKENEATAGTAASVQRVQTTYKTPALNMLYSSLISLCPPKERARVWSLAEIR